MREKKQQLLLQYQEHQLLKLEMKESHKMELTIYLLKTNSNYLINKKMSNKYLFFRKYYVLSTIYLQNINKVYLLLNLLK